MNEGARSFNALLAIYLEGIMCDYCARKKLRDCWEELLGDVSDLIFAQVSFLTTTDSLQLSYDSDDRYFFDTDRRNQARDDDLPPPSSRLLMLT